MRTTAGVRSVVVRATALQRVRNASQGNLYRAEGQLRADQHRLDAGLNHSTHLIIGHILVSINTPPAALLCLGGIDNIQTTDLLDASCDRARACHALTSEAGAVQSGLHFGVVFEKVLRTWTLAVDRQAGVPERR
eukprot:GHUV01058525.1.p2 GENE.GHUV01058525.1~~GHUV01058525.1.p2  ORF type:complete len:135 (+),score=7.24 GHUV01058525.1:322-726(+)